MATQYFVQYNIPRVQVQLPGRQNRLSDGNFRITPSITEPVLFIFGNHDGVPLNLLPFKLHFVVWSNNVLDGDITDLAQSQVVLKKTLVVDDPYAGSVEMVLEEDDTIEIARQAGGNTLRWSIFMVNDQGRVFLSQVSSSGSRYGMVEVDLAGCPPIAEIIRGSDPRP